jgi:hypothetical protein
MNATDPFGLWTIERKGKVYALATSVCGDTIDDLAQIIGLEPTEFMYWLKESKYAFLNDNGKSCRINFDQLKVDDHLRPNLTFKIPNIIVTWWAGEDYWGWGQNYVDWDGQQRYLKDLGFKVIEESDSGHFSAAVKIFSQAKALHGIYFWGHGNDDEFGGVNKADLSRQLNYKLALVLLNACNSEQNGDLFISRYSLFHGAKVLINPFAPAIPSFIAKLYMNNKMLEFEEPWDISDLIQPGDQGTNENAFRVKGSNYIIIA